jgi:hypothetical protein
MFSSEDYTIAASLFPRLLGFIYFFAFGAFIFQIKGLIGQEGILPLKNYLSLLKNYYKQRRYYFAPTVFWWNSSDAALVVVSAIGTALGVGLMFGFFPPLLLFLCYVLYLSIVTAGQDFLGFGWEGFLLETTVHAFFISLTSIPNFVVWFSVNFLLFRFHFQAGMVKLISKDPAWRNLKAIAYHYLTQPLPNTVAWFVHKLPMPFQKLTCIVMFVIEIVAPFGIFLTEEVRFGVALLFIGLQLGIWATGNFSFLNHLTVALTVLLISNRYLELFFSAPEVVSASISTTVLLSIFGAGMLFLQMARMWHHYLKSGWLSRLFYWTSPYFLANKYGIFAVMTVRRYEIVVEGSDDQLHWKEYAFRWKPSETTRRPRRISPYQPRLDWQAWFLPFQSFESAFWFHNFLFRLLKGSKPVLSLMRINPFPDKPPKYVRAIAYDYVYSNFKELRQEKIWWKRVFVTDYSPILSLKENSL